MPRWFETVTDLDDARQRAIVRCRRYGMIEMADQQLVRVSFCPLPKLAGPLDMPWGHVVHRAAKGNHCWLYFNQPRGLEQFLALKFVVSTRRATLATFRGALEVLDEVARIKQTEAIVCDVANWRISDRLLARWGWVPHKPQRWHRNYIKRFAVTAELGGARGGRIGDLPVGDMGEGRHGVQFGWPLADDIADLPAADDERVGNEPAVAAPRDGLGAHQRSSAFGGCRRQLS